jgi:hypothetical protein
MRALSVRFTQFARRPRQALRPDGGRQRAIVHVVRLAAQRKLCLLASASSSAAGEALNSAALRARYPLRLHRPQRIAGRAILSAGEAAEALASLQATAGTRYDAATALDLIHLRPCALCTTSL